MQFIKCILALLIFYFVVTSCKKESDLDRLNTNWNPEYAIALVNANLSIEEILDSRDQTDFISVDSNTQLLSLIYQNRFESGLALDYLDLPNLPGIVNSNSNKITYTQDSLNFIEEVQFSTGIFEYTFVKFDTADLQVTFTIPDLKNSGQEFTFIEVFSGVNNLPMTFSDSRSLMDYILKLNNNKLEILYEVIDLNTSLDVTSSHPLVFEIKDLNYNYITGCFQNLDLGSYNDSIQIKLFKNWKEGTIELASPKIEIIVENSFGLPINLDLIEMSGLNPADPNISSPIIDSPIIVNFPDTNSIGNSAVTKIQLNSSNSNIGDFISFHPNFLDYDYSLEASQTKDTNTLYFISADSEISFDISLELPMEGRLNGVVVQDSFSLTEDAKEIFDDLQSATFKLSTINRLPIDAEVQLFFADANYAIIDSIPDNSSSFISSGEIDMNGIVITASEEENFIPYTKDEEITLENSEYIIIKLVLNSTNNGIDPVKIISDYNIEIKLGLIANSIIKL